MLFKTQTHVPRRVLLLVALTMVALPAVAAYPDRPIKVVVPFAAGGAGDISARLVSEELRKILQVPVVVENRPGGNGLVGAAQLAKAAPDGYTIGFNGNTVHAGGHAVFKAMPFHPINDFAPIALTFSSPYVLVAGPQMPASSPSELLAWVQAHPKEATYSYHNGSSRVAAHLYLQRVRTSALAVPYVSPVAALTDVAGGTTAFGFYEPITVKGLMDAQRIRALAVTSDVRLPMLPEVPTLKESGVDVHLRAWTGCFAPAGTPEDVIATLSQAIKQALERAAVKEKAHSLGMAVEYLPPDRFREFIAAETQFWKKQFSDAGIAPQ
ncbi:Bug family tripartite tricarboxylate transporter substrate binding protein [Ottowia thiooxydans]|uniref:Bug family tripartite tricarboxylate transporter substrate binding protein n=1 Tax=Ottowia thiooxydans TaxID=219182 RepID=UPI0004037A66|nr:tripartite tricarboxylate transporter substrate binding protein [Ottowia thiooxydans]